MAEKYKGLTIALGLDTDSMGNGMNVLRRQTKELNKHMTLLNKSIKFDVSNIVYWQGMQKTLSNNIEVTENKLKMLTVQIDKYKATSPENQTAQWQAKLNTLENELLQNQNALVRYNKQLTTVDKTLGSFDVKRTVSEVKELDKAFDTVTAEIKSFNDIMNKSDVYTTDKQVAHMKAYETAIGLAETKATELNNTLNRLDDFNLDDEEVSKLSTQLNKAENEASQLKTELSNMKVNTTGLSNLSTSIGGISKSFETAGRSSMIMGTAMFYGLTRVSSSVGGAIMSFADYEDKLLLFQAITQGTTGEMEQLETVTLNLAKTTRFTADETAEASRILAQSGMDLGTVVTALPQVLNFTSASGMEIADATSVLIDNTKAWGLSVDEMTTIADQWTVASTKTNTSIAELGEANLTVAGQANIMNQDMAETNALLGIMADNGIKGSEGGRILRNMMISLTKTTAPAQEELDKLGISMFNADGSARQMSEVLAEMNIKFSELNYTQQDTAVALNNIFTKRDIKGATVLINEFTDPTRFKLLTEVIDNSAFATENFAKTMESGTGGTIRIIKSNIEALGIAFSERLAPTIEVVGELIKKFTGWFSELSQTSSNVMIGILAVSLGLSGLTAVFGALTFGIGKTIGLFKHFIDVGVKLKGLKASATVAKLGTSFSSLGISLAAIAPIALPIVAVIGALGAVAYTTYKEQKRLKEIYDKSANGLKENSKSYQNLITIQEEVDKSTGDLGGSIEGATNAFDTLEENATQALKDMNTEIGVALTKFDTMAKVGNGELTIGAKNAFLDLAETIDTSVENVLTSTGTMVDVTLNRVQGAFDTGVVDFGNTERETEIVGNYAASWETAKVEITNSKNAIQEVSKTAVNENRQLTKEEETYIEQHMNNINAIMSNFTPIEPKDIVGSWNDLSAEDVGDTTKIDGAFEELRNAYGETSDAAITSSNEQLIAFENLARDGEISFEELKIARRQLTDVIANEARRGVIAERDLAIEMKKNTEDRIADIDKEILALEEKYKGKSTSITSNLYDPKYAAELAKLTEEQKALTDEVVKFDGQIDTANASLGEFSSFSLPEFNTMTSFAENVTGELEGAETELDKFKAVYNTAFEEMGINSEVEITTSMQTALEDLITGFNGMEDITSGKMDELNNMLAEAYNIDPELLKTAALGGADTYKNALSGKFTELGITNTDELTTAMKSEESLQKLFDAGLITAEQFNIGMEEISAKESGKKKTDEVSEGVKSGKEKVKESGKEVAKEVEKELGKADGKGKGAEISKGYGSGIEHKRSYPRERAKNMASDVKREISSIDSKEIGKAVSIGMGDGIYDMAWYAAAQAGEMGLSVQRQVEKNLQVNSPSKVFKRIGSSVPEGFALGIKNGTNRVVEQAIKMSNSVNENLNINPVDLTPVGNFRRMANALPQQVSSQSTETTNNFTININSTATNSKDLVNDIAEEVNKILGRRLI